MRRFLMRIPTDRGLHAGRALLLLMPPALLFGPAVADVIFCLIGALFLVHAFQARDWSWLQQRWVQWGLALGLYVAARNLWLNDGGEQALMALGWLRLPLGAAALAYWLLPDAPTERWLVRGLSFTVLVLVADALWQFHAGTDILGHAIVISEGFPRLTGPYVGPRVGVTLVWLVFPVIACMLGQSALPERWRWSAGQLLVIATAVVVYVSGERMALGLLALGISLCLLLLPKIRRPLLVALGVAAVAAHVLSLADHQLSARQVGATSHTVGGFRNSVYGRTWASAAAILENHPLFGVGSHGFQGECVKPEYGPTTPEALIQRCPLHPHNLYLAWAAEGGSIGLGLMLGLIVCWASLGVRHWRTWRYDALSTGLAVALMLRLWPISVTPNHMASWVLLPLWFFVGWWLARLRPAPTPQSAA